MRRHFTLRCAASLFVAVWTVVAAPATAQETKPVKNRLEQLEQVRKEFAPADPNRQYGAKDQITISGLITTADGSPPPTPLLLNGVTRRPNHASSFTVLIEKDGRFTQAVEFGSVFLYATAPTGDYAPVLLGPLQAEPGGKIDNLRLVLNQGVTAKIRLSDEQGQPVVGASLTAWHIAGEHGNGALVGKWKVVTNEEGRAAFEHCADFPLTVDTETAGFQHDRVDFRPQAGAPFEWRLTESRTTTGRIVSRDEGRPIVGAEVRLVQRLGFAPRTFMPHNEQVQPPVVTKTNKEGRFTLDSLRDDSRYTLWITSPDHGGEIAREVRSGQSDLEFELGPPRTLRGKVVGALDRLQRLPVKGQMTPAFRCINPLRLENVTYAFPMTVPVEVRGGEGHFEIRDLLPGQARLSFPGVTKTVPLSEPVEDLVIELTAAPGDTPAPATGPHRKVVLKLKTPAGEPPPRGELLVRVFPQRSNATHETKTLPVTGTQVEFSAPVPCRLQWETDNLVGYWIKEESVELADAPDPLVKEINAFPAGAIYGRVFDSGGSPCNSFNYSIVMVSQPRELQQPHLGISLGGASRDGTGRFVVGPLPLDGTYRVEIQGQNERANTRAASEDLTLTRDESVRNVELRLPEGVAIEGQVVDPLGKPTEGVEVRLGHRTANRSYEGASVTTDGEGKFRFPHVNPELPGAYYLHVKPQQVYRGQQLMWRPGEEPLVVRLQRGWSIDGMLLEHNTGKVIPGAKVYAHPSQYDQKFYLGSHDTVTDAAGRFRLQTLEPLPYRFYANNVNAAQGAPPWEVDPRTQEEVILSGDVQQGADLAPVPPPPDEP